LASLLWVAFVTRVAPAGDSTTHENQRINSAAAFLNTLKIAVVDYYSTFGSFPLDDSFELTLMQKGLLDRSARFPTDGKEKSSTEFHVHVVKALSATTVVTATNAADNLAGASRIKPMVLWLSEP